MQMLCIPLRLNSPVMQKSQSGLDPRLLFPLGSLPNPNLSASAMFNLLFSPCAPHGPYHSAQTFHRAVKGIDNSSLACGFGFE